MTTKQTREQSQSKTDGSKTKKKAWVDPEIDVVLASEAEGITFGFPFTDGVSSQS
jgi:hypothetical protein